MLKPQTIEKIYTELKNTLESSEAELEARLILENILNISPSEIISNQETILTQNQINKIYSIKEQRNSKKIPLAYLLEEAHFMNLKLFVNNDVLIPRPETELLIDQTLEEIKKRKIHQATILDLCTGSGCIAISLKLALPGSKIYASDISKSALNVASINAKRYGAEIEFVLSDYLDAFLPQQSQSAIAVPIIRTQPPYFDIIISNPPYISEEDYSKLEPELFHEPKHALVGFPYRHIQKQSAKLIKDNGFLICEFGQGQANKILEIFPNATIYKDYNGIERFFVT